MFRHFVLFWADCSLPTEWVSDTATPSAWLTAQQRQWDRVICQWVKINTKSYWSAGEKGEEDNECGCEISHKWSIQEFCMREPSHFVFIQWDREQRAAIVQPGWCCQSSQSNTAGGGQASLSVTHTRAHTRKHTQTDFTANAHVGLFPDCAVVRVTRNRLPFYSTEHNNNHFIWCGWFSLFKHHFKGLVRSNLKMKKDRIFSSQLQKYVSETFVTLGIKRILHEVHKITFQA